MLFRSAGAAEPPASGPAEPSVSAAAEPPGAYAQLATLFSEDATQAELKRLRGLIPPPWDKGRALTVRPAQLSDGRTAWRIVVTGFASRAEARTFCGHIASGGLGCIARG